MQEGNAEEAAYQATKLKEQLIVDVDVAFTTEMRLVDASAELREQLENRAKGFARTDLFLLRIQKDKA